MKIAFSEITTPSKGVIAVGVTEEGTLGATARALDEQSGGCALTRALGAGRFKGKQGTSTTVVAPHGLAVDAVILMGLGQPGKIDGRGLRALGGNVVRKMNAAGAKTGAVAVDAVDGTSVAPPAMAADIALGARLGSYSFDKYHTKKKDEDKKSLSELTVMLDEPAAAEDAFEANASLADGVFAARDLVSEPSNVKYPKTIAEDIEALTDDGIEVELLDHDKMASLGMGSLLGVAQGSEHEPYLAVMRWNGAPEGADQQPVAFIGKGVTFDNRRHLHQAEPGHGGDEVRHGRLGGGGRADEMPGRPAARRGSTRSAWSVWWRICPTARRSGPAMSSPSMSGQTIEVINTDAEGPPRARRCALVRPGDLQAALHGRPRHADRRDHREPRHLQGRALQQRRRAVGTVDRGGQGERRGALAPAARRALQQGYRFRHRRHEETSARGGRPAASPARSSSSVFVNGVPWAHLDIAGMAWMKGSHDPTVPKGASGFGVRLLDQLVRAHYEA